MTRQYSVMGIFTNVYSVILSVISLQYIHNHITYFFIQKQLFLKSVYMPEFILGLRICKNEFDLYHKPLFSTLYLILIHNPLIKAYGTFFVRQCRSTKHFLPINKESNEAYFPTTNFALKIDKFIITLN